MGSAKGACTILPLYSLYWISVFLLPPYITKICPDVGLFSLPCACSSCPVDGPVVLTWWLVPCWSTTTPGGVETTTVPEDIMKQGPVESMLEICQQHRQKDAGSLLSVLWR